jgi:hypothetical protein
LRPFLFLVFGPAERFSVHIEGGKRNGSGVHIDISGHEGDLRVSNTSVRRGAYA